MGDLVKEAREAHIRADTLHTKMYEAREAYWTARQTIERELSQAEDEWLQADREAIAADVRLTLAREEK